MGKFGDLEIYIDTNNISHTQKDKEWICYLEYQKLQTSMQCLLVLWSTQRSSTFMSTQRISRHVDIIFNISTKEQWKNKMSIITHEAASLGPKRHINKLRALMNRYWGKLIMYACITRETFVFTVFRRVFPFDFETRIMSTCMSTSRSNYTDMSIWKKHADHSTSAYL